MIAVVREEFNFIKQSGNAGDLEAVVGQLCLEILLLGGFYSFPKDKGILVLGVF